MFIFALATSARVTWLNWIHHPTFHFGLQFDLLFPRWSWWKLFSSFIFHCVDFLLFFVDYTIQQQQHNKRQSKNTKLTKNTWINLNNWRFSSNDLLNLFFLNFYNLAFLLYSLNALSLLKYYLLHCYFVFISGFV